MRWLNYHHLYYFHRVARAGSLAAAAKELRVSHSTLSVQIRELGEVLGGPLFEKRGRKLVLTPRGEEVLGYADDIFRLGAELLDVVGGGAPSQRARKAVRIGLVPGMPRSLAYRLLEGALSAHDGPVLLRTGRQTTLLEELAGARLHLVLGDEPADAASSRAPIETHPLGRSGIAFYGSGALARSLRASFPRSLGAAPLILPAPGTGLRRLVDRWLASHAITPRIAFEVEDAAMIRTLGAHGRGVFPVRLALRAEVEDSLAAELVGTLDGVEETYFAFSIARRVRHPFVGALVERARHAFDAR